MVAKAHGALISWVFPKASGIRIREMLNLHDGEAYGASYLVVIPAKLTGRLRERKQFKTKTEAEAWAEKQFKGCKKQGEDFFALTDAERREVAANMPLLREHGVSISEAVRFALKHLRAEGRGKTLRQMVDELIASKAQRFERGDLRQRSFEDFRHRAEKFAEGFDGRIAAEVSAQKAPRGLRRVSLAPMVWTIRQPPLKVPSAIAACAERMTHVGTWNVCWYPDATSRPVMIPMVFWASLVPWRSCRVQPRPTAVFEKRSPFCAGWTAETASTRQSSGCRRGQAQG